RRLRRKACGRPGSRGCCSGCRCCSCCGHTAPAESRSGNDPGQSGERRNLAVATGLLPPLWGGWGVAPRSSRVESTIVECPHRPPHPCASNCPPLQPCPQKNLARGFALDPKG